MDLHAVIKLPLGTGEHGLLSRTQKEGKLKDETFYGYGHVTFPLPVSHKRQQST